MGNLANFFLGLTGPIVVRVLASLGLGLVSYAALSAIASSVVAHVQSSYGAMPTSVISIADLLGVGTSMGIVLGAIVARAAYAAVTRISHINA